MERGTITIKLANGKELETNNGEEVHWFFQSEGNSIVAPPPKVDRVVNQPKK